MQEAIRMVQELVNEKTEVTPEQKQEHMNRLKPEINNLLHQFLPDDITIKEVEILAMVINEMIWNPHKFLNVTKLSNDNNTSSTQDICCHSIVYIDDDNFQRCQFCDKIVD